MCESLPLEQQDELSMINYVSAARMLEVADKLKVLRDEKANVEERLKAIVTIMNNLEYELSDLIAETDTPNFTRAGTMFVLSHKLRASAVLEKKAELYEALKANGFEDLVCETVNHNTLSSFVKEQIERCC